MPFCSLSTFHPREGGISSCPGGWQVEGSRNEAAKYGRESKGRWLTPAPSSAQNGDCSAPSIESFGLEMIECCWFSTSGVSWVKFKIGPLCRGQGETTGKSAEIGRRQFQQARELAIGGASWAPQHQQISAPPLTIFQLGTEASPAFCLHVQCSDGLSHTLLSRGCILEMTGERAGRLPLPRGQLEGQPGVTSSQ